MAISTDETDPKMFNGLFMNLNNEAKFGQKMECFIEKNYLETLKFPNTLKDILETIPGIKQEMANLLVEREVKFTLF